MSTDLLTTAVKAYENNFVNKTHIRGETGRYIVNFPLYSLSSYLSELNCQPLVD